MVTTAQSKLPPFKNPRNGAFPTLPPATNVWHIALTCCLASRLGNCFNRCGEGTKELFTRCFRAPRRSKVAGREEKQDMLTYTTLHPYPDRKRTVEVKSWQKTRSGMDFHRRSTVCTDLLPVSQRIPQNKMSDSPLDAVGVARVVDLLSRQGQVFSSRARHETRLLQVQTMLSTELTLTQKGAVII